MADQNKKQYIKYEDTTYILQDSRIPDPVAADNGKVLGIVNGAYALKQEQGGGGEGTVKSVNNIEPDANGDVTLSIPSKTSDLQNDSGFLTQHQSLAAYRTASAQDTIDAAQDTAIAAKYSKPSGGIPASDLASAVQTSLGKADTALQHHQSLSGYATESWVQQQGYQTAQQVQTAIAAIPDELPSGGSTGDFLRKTASGVAWETVPAAESASFGGGA